MTALLASTTSAENDQPIEKPEEFPDLDLGKFWNWQPTRDYLTMDQLFPRTSYSAALMLMHANRGVEPEVLLVRENPNDAKKILQYRGSPRQRGDNWKLPIGKFDPHRNEEGTLDKNIFDTLVQEILEETGIDLRSAGRDEDESQRIFMSLENAPVLENRILSKRPPSVFHIDRFHFLVTPRRLQPKSSIWKKQIELKDVRFFRLFELPLKDENGEGASMMPSHVQRIVEFISIAHKTRWAAGIPDDAEQRIRSRFSWAFK